MFKFILGYLASLRPDKPLSNQQSNKLKQLSGDLKAEVRRRKPSWSPHKATD